MSLSSSSDSDTILRFPTLQKLPHLATDNQLTESYRICISETSIVCKLVRNCKKAVSCVDIKVAVTLGYLY